MTETKPPKVFISYSHDSEEHRKHVLDLSERLRRDGIDSILDLYEESPPEGWTRWMDRNIRDSDFVLMICTEYYYRGVMLGEQPGKKFGVKWEGKLIYQHIYNADSTNTRFIPILFEYCKPQDIPTPLQDATYYFVNTEQGYEDLYRRLTNQPRVKKAALGTLRRSALGTSRRSPMRKRYAYHPRRVHLSRPDITEKEIEAVCAVLRSPNLSLGPKLVEFETAFAEYIGVKRAVAVNSGTSGLFLCMLALEIGPGDEVITTPFTFISSATTIMMAGARPVFVDIDPATLNIDPAKIESRITSKTKAILPVEVFGSPAGLDKVCEIAQKHNLMVIEDSCEALGSALNGKKVGTFGMMSVFGFYPNKQITTGEGGMILTGDDDLADMCLSLRNQGRGKNGSWLSHERLGYNYRLSDINCALGIVQLSRIEQFKARRRQVAKWYQEMLADDDRLIVPAEPAGCDMSWFVFVLRLAERFTRQQRDKILEAMKDRGIQVSNYFVPVHLQPFMVEQFGYKKGDFPVAESVSERTIALPFYNNLTEDETAIVCKQLKETLDKISPAV